MLKPRPMNYTPDLGHLATCTSCQNAAAARYAARAYRPKMRSGAPHLLVDDAALDSWSGVVLELEAPRKGRALFKQPALRKTRRSPSVLYRDHPVPRVGFGMPGSVVYEGGRFRAWLGQASTKYCESEDGIHFDSCAGLDRGLAWLPQPIPYSVLNGKFGGQTESVRQRQQRYLQKPTSYWGELGDDLLNRREIAQETFTVYKDETAHPAERYKSAFTCDLFGHAPYPAYWLYKRGNPPPLDKWLAAPIFNGERHYTWESTCFGYSSDGMNWTMYDMGHQLGEGPEPLRSASDTANGIYDTSRRRRILRSIGGRPHCHPVSTGRRTRIQIGGVRCAACASRAIDAFKRRRVAAVLATFVRRSNGYLIKRASRSIYAVRSTRFR